MSLRVDSTVMRRIVMRCRIEIGKRLTWKLVLQIAILAAFLFVVIERLVIAQIPYSTPVGLMPHIVMQTNPRVPVSPNIELFSMREFSRVCCDYGPTIYRGPTLYEKTFVKYGIGERGYYSFSAAKREFVRSGKTRCTVFVPSATLSEFIEDFFLPLEKHMRVVVVSGQEDCGPSELFGGGRSQCRLSLPIGLSDFLDDERLVHWFAQNYDIIGCRKVPTFPDDCIDPVLSKNASKLEPIVLGLDYHSRAEKQFRNRESPAEQEFALKHSHSKPWTSKKLKVIAIFSLHPMKPDRQILKNRLPVLGDCAIRPTLKYSVKAFWALHDDAAFVLNPQGNGIDTHRIYEALNLHTVPVVRSSPLDSLYKQFPIIIVSSWEEITSCKQLEKWKKTIQERFGETPFQNPMVQKKLKLSYWKNQVEQWKEHYNV